MNVPEPLENEGTKAYAAFRAYVEQGDNRSISKVARQLSKSRQLIVRWATKYRWKARLAERRLHEVQQNIALETKAREQMATITEERRARVAERAFAVAERMIGVADAVMEQHPTSSARLLATGIATVQAIGGCATNYNAPSPTVTIVEQWVGEGAPPKKIESIEEAERIIAEYEEADKVRELPCGGWSPDHVDATPAVIDDEPAPVVTERAPNPDLVVDRLARIPSRGGSQIPTSDGRGSR
jgi:hypothetical protein